MLKNIPVLFYFILLMLGGTLSGFRFLYLGLLVQASWISSVLWDFQSRMNTMLQACPCTSSSGFLNAGSTLSWTKISSSLEFLCDPGTPCTQTLLSGTASVLWVLLLVSFSSFFSSCFRHSDAVSCVVLRSPGFPYVWPSRGSVWYQFFPFCVLSSWRFCSCRLTWSFEFCRAAGRFSSW